jgi:hypothetical protein
MSLIHPFVRGRQASDFKTITSAKGAQDQSDASSIVEGMK